MIDIKKLKVGDILIVKRDCGYRGELKKGSEVMIIRINLEYNRIYTSYKSNSIGDYWYFTNYCDECKNNINFANECFCALDYKYNWEDL